VFLPLISALLALLLLATGCSPPSNPSATGGGAPGPLAVPQASKEVLVGSGEVAPELLLRVDAEVEAGLRQLEPTLPAAEPGRRPFRTFVHAQRSAMPEALALHLHADSPAFAILGQHQIHIVLGELRRLGANLAGVVRHELVHELLDQHVGRHGRRIPRWFHEGLAQHLAGDTYLGAREEDLLWPGGIRQLHSFGELRGGFPHDRDALQLAYAQSYSYVAWLVRQHGLADLLAIARATDDVTSFEQALVGRLGRSTLQLEEAWRRHLQHGSGASWRLLLDQWFSYCLLAALPILVLALMRRLTAEQRAGRRLAAIEAENAARAAAAASALAAASPPAEPSDSPPPIGVWPDRPTP
jgi:hypothetical protein